MKTIKRDRLPTPSCILDAYSNGPVAIVVAGTYRIVMKPTDGQLQWATKTRDAATMRWVTIQSGSHEWHRAAAIEICRELVWFDRITALASLGNQDPMDTAHLEDWMTRNGEPSIGTVKDQVTRDFNEFSERVSTAWQWLCQKIIDWANKPSQAGAS